MLRGGAGTTRARSPPCLLVAQVEPSPEAAEPLKEEEASRVPEIPKCESLSGSPVEVSPRGLPACLPIGDLTGVCPVVRR